MNTKSRFGFLIIMAAALVSVSLFVIWPSAIRGRSAPGSPEQVVESFYQDYLAYIGEPGSENFRNPLVDRHYRESELLTASFKEHIDELLEKKEGIIADPFLCAQDIPGEIEIMGIHQDENRAQVIGTSFSGHVFTVDLRQEKDAWLIANVSCGGTPQSQAKAFYTWYLGAIGSRGQGESLNPLSERSYHQTPVLSTDFTAAVDEMLEADDKGSHDPFLLAQDIPTRFSVDTGLTADSAVVHLQFGQNTVSHLKVSFVREDGRLVIENIGEDQR